MLTDEEKAAGRTQVELLTSAKSALERLTDEQLAAEHKASLQACLNSAEHWITQTLMSAGPGADFGR